MSKRMPRLDILLIILLLALLPSCEEDIPVHTTTTILCNSSFATNNQSTTEQCSFPEFNLVIVGASVMEQSFEDQSLVVSNAFLYNHGLEVNIYEEATAGDTSTEILGDMDTILGRYTDKENVFVLLHVGGNDVTNTKPYSTATDAQKDTLRDNLEEISSKIKAAGHEPIFSNISFRTYADPELATTTIIFENQGSDPYNSNIVNTVAKNESPDFVDDSDIPFIDLYTLLYNNKRTWLDSDGIHPNDTGEAGIRNYVVSKLAEVWKTSTTSSITEVPVSMMIFDAAPYQAPFVAGINKLKEDASGTLDIINIKNEVVPGVSVTTSFDGNNPSGGKAIAANTGVSLINSGLVASFLYQNIGTTGRVTISGLTPGKVGQVVITASRDTGSGTRTSTYTILGNSVTLDAELATPGRVTLEFTVPDDGIIELEVTNAGDFAYLGGFSLEYK